MKRALTLFQNTLTPYVRMIEPQLIQIIRKQFVLEWTGIHGAPHWARVRENGLRLAGSTGADPRVIELFAFLHDSRRMNDGYDPMHGQRAADFARMLALEEIEIDSVALELLVESCQRHSAGQMEGDITVLTCWDADRLDLGRVGIKPDPNLLCTEAARMPETLEWAYRRSVV